MKRWDLIVIGMGLAGLTAARTAVERGAKVLIIGRGMGSVTLFRQHDRCPRQRPAGSGHGGGRHALDRDKSPSSVRPNGMDGNCGVAERLPGAFPAALHLDTVGSGNSLVPTGAGTLRPTYLLPVTMTAGAGMSAADTLIVGLKGSQGLSGRYGFSPLAMPRCESLPPPLRPGGSHRDRPCPVDG